jgi:hypothetical protein
MQSSGPTKSSESQTSEDESKSRAKTIGGATDSGSKAMKGLVYHRNEPMTELKTSPHKSWRTQQTVTRAKTVVCSVRRDEI